MVVFGSIVHVCMCVIFVHAVYAHCLMSLHVCVCVCVCVVIACFVAWVMFKRLGAFQVDQLFAVVCWLLQYNPSISHMFAFSPIDTWCFRAFHIHVVDAAAVQAPARC